MPDLADLAQIQYCLDLHVIGKRTTFYIHHTQVEIVTPMLLRCGRPFVVADAPDPEYRKVSVN